MVCKKCIILIIGISTTLFACICFAGSQKTNELTQKHGAELQAAYENYVKARVAALETSDASKLRDTTTGWELKRLTEIIERGQAQEILEGSKVKVETLQVEEYSPDAATIFMHQSFIGNIPDRSISERPWICQLEKKDDTWKISKCRPPDFE